LSIKQALPPHLALRKAIEYKCKSTVESYKQLNINGSGDLTFEEFSKVLKILKINPESFTGLTQLEIFNMVKTFNMSENFLSLSFILKTERFKKN
jgi:hypothetical protein